MRRLLFSLAGAGAISLGGADAAQAAPAGVPFTVFLDGGPTQSASGTLSFALSKQVPGGACRYAMTWSGGFDHAAQAACWVDEATWHGNWSCTDNASDLVPSIVLRAPGEPCSGFDGLRIYDIFQLVLSERSGTPSFVGVVQWTAASTTLYGMFALSDP